MNFRFCWRHEAPPPPPPFKDSPGYTRPRLPQTAPSSRIFVTKPSSPTAVGWASKVVGRPTSAVIRQQSRRWLRSAAVPSGGLAVGCAGDKVQVLRGPQQTRQNGGPWGLGLRAVFNKETKKIGGS